MADTAFVSRYHQRVAFVQDVLNRNSELGDAAAHEIAVKIGHAIDHIPEPTR